MKKTNINILTTPATKYTTMPKTPPDN
jgi:hypothetical protein